MFSARSVGECEGLLDGHFLGGQDCCWVQFHGMNFGIRIGLKDSGAYGILDVKSVLKLNKGTKHWHLQAFISIAARLLGCDGLLGLLA